MNNNNGYTLIELLITVTIIGILAAIGIPGYIGHQANASRVEAYQNLESLRLFEEQLFSETAAYAIDTGINCGPANENVAAIQAVLPGFQPGEDLQFSYCIERNVDIAGADTTPTNCFRAQAFGKAGSRVEGEVYAIDCTNAKTY